MDGDSIHKMCVTLNNSTAMEEHFTDQTQKSHKVFCQYADQNGRHQLQMSPDDCPGGLADFWSQGKPWIAESPYQSTRPSSTQGVVSIGFVRIVG